MVDVEVTACSDPEAWDRCVDRTSYATAFHRYDALRALADHSGTRLLALVAREGTEPVGAFPLFVGSLGPFTTVVSPPTSLEVPALGPLRLDHVDCSQRKAEHRNRALVESSLDWVDERVDPDLLDVRAVDRYVDTRPFDWLGFDVEPSYTYVVDLDPGVDALWSAASGDLRTNVRSADEVAHEVRVGGREDVQRVVEQVARRFERQGLSYGLSVEAALDLGDALPEGCLTPYVCTVEGEFAGGLLTVRYGDTVAAWQGGARPDVDVPVNDVLDWHCLEEAVADGYDRYELVGAMEPHLCEYKAKFGPRPAVVPLVRRTSRRFEAAASVYDHLPRGLRAVV
ncbi:GNAT family N-acetyltransferase [Halomarina ordinaria]|uniref:GNAT family N-acetyltransferase n=1 Tax=Halomarina ordinaria TaxID=3033939 RepID=A0ABD5U5V0_9EURY|nr:GNAT family N-acetyltransferase [Halomarina sp. PSRA2]